jgi:DNA repair protein RecO
MEWRDEGIILGTRRHGETSAILEVMTRAHGRHLGLVRGGRSRKQQPVLQPGTASSFCGARGWTSISAPSRPNRLS